MPTHAPQLSISRSLARFAGAALVTAAMDYVIFPWALAGLTRAGMLADITGATTGILYVLLAILNLVPICVWALEKRYALVGGMLFSLLAGVAGLLYLFYQLLLKTGV